MRVFVLWIYQEGREFLPQEHRVYGLVGEAPHTRKGVPRSSYCWRLLKGSELGNLGRGLQARLRRGLSLDLDAGLTC